MTFLGLTYSVDQIASDADIDQFVKQNKTHQEIPEPFEYEPYVSVCRESGKTKIIIEIIIVTMTVARTIVIIINYDDSDDNANSNYNIIMMMAVIMTLLHRAI